MVRRRPLRGQDIACENLWMRVRSSPFEEKMFGSWCMWMMRQEGWTSPVTAVLHLGWFKSTV